MKRNRITRGDFLKTAAAIGGLAPFAAHFSDWADRKQHDLELHVFSKHLQFLDYREMANAAADIGFSGVDLTVRPNGHVSPEQVRRDLPEAVEAVNKAGLMSRMMTTAVDDAHDETDRNVLRTAAEQGMEYYRMNWLRFDPERTLPESLQVFQSRLGELAELNRELDIVGCYQNHSGMMAGATLWEVYKMLEHAAPEGMGVQYDIRHATVEGGLSWRNGLRLIYPRISTIALKDFKWQKTNSGWEIRNTPIGEGMVDFSRYFRLLKEYGIHVPVSVHFEYPLGGAEHGHSELTVNKNVIYKAMERDLEMIRKLWNSA